MPFMGLTYADITIENTFRKVRIEARVLVDSGSVFLTIPPSMAETLGFDVTEVETRDVWLADGTSRTVPHVGPIRLHFAGRSCHISALVLGDEPLMGVVAMEMMDLVLHPQSQTLTVNPKSPLRPSALCKRAA
jgi:clan AA aspartic protease